MKRDIASQRGIDMILHVYTRNVKTAAISALLAHGFLGVEPMIAGAPSSLLAIREVMERKPRPKLFPVFSGGSEKTVFDDPMVNLLFRAWHDITHYELNAPFTRAGEAAVADRMAERLEGIDKAILKSDITDQIDYYYANHGYVDDQRAFVVSKVFGEPLPVAA